MRPRTKKKIAAVMLLHMLLKKQALIRRKRNERKRRFGVHPILRGRKQLGEFYTLYREERADPAKFFSCYRMSVADFDFLLSRTKCQLENRTRNHCDATAISAEQRPSDSD